MHIVTGDVFQGSTPARHDDVHAARRAERHSCRAALPLMRHAADGTLAGRSPAERGQMMTKRDPYRSLKSETTIDAGSPAELRALVRVDHALSASGDDR